MDTALSAPTKRAAVLLLLGLDGTTLNLLLTKRSDHLRLHAGQVSLPGGKPEPTDKDASHTALRESSEEIGLNAEDVRLLGYSPPVITSTNYLVDVSVGLATRPVSEMIARLSPHPEEVSDVWFTPVEHLFDLSLFERQNVKTQSGHRQFYMIKGTQPLVWGATAAMIRNFVLHLSS